MEIKGAQILDLNIRYSETEGDSAIPLIILHGWGSSVNSWEKVMTELEKSNIKVFMPDLPGFGESQEPPSPWGVKNYIEFLEEFRKRMELNKFVLGGHSFGGQIAISYALNNPNKLAGLILMDAARIMRRRKLKVKIFSLLAHIGNSTFSIPPLHFLKPLTQKIWSKLSGERDYYLASPIMKETMRKVLGEEVGGMLGDIKTKTLILWGEKDYVTPLSDARIINERIKGSKLVVFKNAAHPINVEKPLEVAQSISVFMEELRS